MFSHFVVETFRAYGSDQLQTDSTSGLTRIFVYASTFMSGCLRDCVKAVSCLLLINRIHG